MSTIESNGSHLHNAVSTSASGRFGGGGLLRSILRENSLFSVTSGAVSALASGWLDGRLGIDAWILVGVGVGLVVYGVFVFLSVRDDRKLSAIGRMAVGGDIAWVVLSLVLIASGALTPTGNIATAVLAGVVAIFAAGQYIGLKRLAGAA